MNEFGYAPKTKYFSARNKHFFTDSDSIPDYFRFYFWYPPLVESGELHLYFELHKEHVKYGEKIHNNNELQELIKIKAGAKIDSIDGEGFFHIVHFIDPSFKDFKPSNTFSTHLHKVMNDTFFNKENGLLWKCIEIIHQKEIVEKPKADV